MIAKTTQNAKFRLFVRHLRGVLPPLPVDLETVAVGLLERLWHTAATSAPRGDIGRFSDDLICEMVGWHGESTTLIGLLLECGWLDPSDEHRLIVHDWAQHCPTYVKGNVAQLGGFASVGAASGGAPQGAPPKGPPSKPPPSRACGHQTRPDQTRPNHTTTTTDYSASINGAAGQSVAVVADEKVREWAGRLWDSQASRKTSRMSRELCLEAAGVALGLGEPDLLADLCKRIRVTDGKDYVRDPSRFVRGAMRSACAERGQDWIELRKQVVMEKTCSQKM